LRDNGRKFGTSDSGSGSHLAPEKIGGGLMASPKKEKRLVNFC